jgi:hypothetical protein
MLLRVKLGRKLAVLVESMFTVVQASINGRKEGSL